jgi:hypothetical protein
MPDNRRLPLFTSRAKVKLGSITIETDVHSSPELTRFLVGRGFLRNLVAILDGFDEVLSVSAARR